MSEYFMQVCPMTDEEKFEMYMKVPHEELVRMKIESEKYEAMIEDERCGIKECKKRCKFFHYNDQFLQRDKIECYIPNDPDLIATSVNKVIKVEK